jgi:hypothetical protein
VRQQQLDLAPADVAQSFRRVARGVAGSILKEACVFLRGQNTEACVGKVTSLIGFASRVSAFGDASAAGAADSIFAGVGEGALPAGLKWR